MYICESFLLQTENPLHDVIEKVREGAAAGTDLKDVRAVYPVIRGINGDKMTRNSTLYPRESIIGNKKRTNPTGYYSFVYPYGKPILKEHRLQDAGGFFSSGPEASTPLGRILFAGWKARDEEVDGKATPAPKGVPGTLEGCGYMKVVPVISDEASIPLVLGGALCTVSIGSEVDKIIESISGVDLVKCYRDGQELPPYRRGDWAEINGEKKLSYWTMYGIRGQELSYVNAPSDIHAYTEDNDIGVDGVKLLLGQKKVGSKEFQFFDALTGVEEKWVSEMYDEYAQFCDMKLVDSIRVGNKLWWFGLNQEGQHQSDDIVNPVQSFVESFQGEVEASRQAKTTENSMIDIMNEVLSGISK